MADEEEGEVLDYTSYGLKRLEIPSGVQPYGLILDHNNITKIDNLEYCPTLQQLSLASNHLVRMVGLSHVHHLNVLRLANNSIVHIEGLNNLNELTWLDLSGNSIKVIENLKNNIRLRHLDLSDNNIAVLGDLSPLTNLKTLLLHGNMLSTLKPVSSYLPRSLRVVSLESNQLPDLNEVSYLSCLPSLDQLSVDNNPCVLMTALEQGFDYRPYVVNWCLELRVLDGFVVSEKEKLQGEWLYCQGKARHFHPGEHLQLVQYLATVCPLTASDKLKTEEDAKLGRILSKQRYHQNQLSQNLSSGPLRTDLSPRTHHSINTSGDNHRVNSPRNNSVTSDPNRSTVSDRPPVTAWSSTQDEVSFSSRGSQRSPRNNEDLVVQDVSADDFDSKSTASLLDSESIYLPFDVTATPSNRPMTAPAASTPNTAAFVSSLTSNNVRPSTGKVDSRDTKYDSLEKRKIRPLNQGKGSVKPMFEFSPPQSSGTGPTTRVRRPTPPTAESQDYDTSIDTSAYSDTENMDKVPASELSLIKDKVGARKAQKAATPTIEERKARLFSKKSEKSDSNKSNIPVPNATQRAQIGVKIVSDSKTIKGKLNLEKFEESGRLKTLTGTNMSVRDSGFMSRPCSDAVLGDEQKAATSIQACWRGYRARVYDKQVLAVRKEIRSRRAEDHIVLLKAELEKYKHQSMEEKKLRALQMEAIKTLWQEVQSLQTWKNEVLTSQSFRSSQDSNHKPYLGVTGSQRSSSDRSDTLDRLNESTLRSAFSPVDVEKQRDLEKTCASLQSQVSQLKEALDTISSAVFQSACFTITHGQDTEGPSSLHVTGNFEQELASLESSPCSGRWSSVPHSLSPYPSEEEENYFSQVPQDGVPTPPRALQLDHKGDNSVMLQWQSSKLTDETGNKSILGYRVYVNDKCMALVSSTRTVALVMGLDVATTYKFYVKALSGLGESYESNIIMAKLAKCSEQRRVSESSDSDMPDDSDKDHDSTESHEKRRHRKREIRKTRKVKSPRSEKTKSLRDADRGDSKSASPSPSDRPRITRAASDAAAAILMTPKRHMHKRNKSGDFQKGHFSGDSSKGGSESNVQSSPSDIPPVSSSSSPSSVTSSPTKSYPHHHVSLTQAKPVSERQTPDIRLTSDVRLSTQSAESNNPADMSGTFTVEQASSYLHHVNSITSSVLKDAIPSSKAKLRESHEKDDSVKTHRRKRSSDFKVSELTDGQRDRRSGGSGTGDSEMDGEVGTHRHSERRETEKRLSDGASDDSREGKTRGHRRKRSKDLQTVMGDWKKEDESPGKAGDKPEASPVSKDGDCSNQNRPIIDGRKRHSSGSRPSSPMFSDAGDKDLFEKRRTPMAETLEQRFMNLSSKSSSMGSVNAKALSPNPDSVQRGRQLPDPALLEDMGFRKRTASLGSEKDLPQSGKAEHKSFASKLYQKLQNFSKDKEKIREKSRRKSSGESSRDSKPPSDDESRRPRRISDSDNDTFSEPSRKHGDSSSGSHSDDSRSARPRRTHRRTPSDGKLMPPMDGERPTHSPIIMEGAMMKKGSSNVPRRHASFHGLLPSKQDKHGVPVSEDTEAQRAESGGVALPTELINKVRMKISSRSQHKPVLSGQKQSKGESS